MKSVNEATVAGIWQERLGWQGLPLFEERAQRDDEPRCFVHVDSESDRALFVPL
jgi:hypothetical protein